jgi:hypothetical protein
MPIWKKFFTSNLRILSSFVYIFLIFLFFNFLNLQTVIWLILNSGRSETTEFQWISIKYVKFVNLVRNAWVATVGTPHGRLPLPLRHPPNSKQGHPLATRMKSVPLDSFGHVDSLTFLPWTGETTMELDGGLVLSWWKLEPFQKRGRGRSWCRLQLSSSTALIECFIRD